MAVSSKKPNDDLFALLGSQRFEWKNDPSDEADAVARRVNETLDLLTAIVSSAADVEPLERDQLAELRAVEDQEDSSAA